MKKIISFFFILFIAKLSFTQQPCNDDVIMNMKGTWKKGDDANMHADKNLSQILSRIDKISGFYQEANPHPAGTQAKWYRTMERVPLVKDGPVPYQFFSLYLPWYCDQQQHKPMLSGETGIWGYAFVNRFGWWVSDQYDLLTIKVNGNDVYILPTEKGTWKGYSLYQNSAYEDESYCILLTHDHNHEPLWKPVTQGEYLNAVRTAWEAQKKQAIDYYANYEEGMKKGIIEMQNNKNLKEDAKKTIITGMQKNLDDFEKTKETQIAESNKLFDDKIVVIDKYVAQNPASLHQPAVIERKMMNDFAGSFSTAQNGGQALACFNPAYFNMKLPSYSPQFIVLEWRWEKNIQGFTFKKQIEENFPVEKLKEMIDK
ncbi:MAG: hypothetical protein ACHQF0_08970 [Chitinophagales bacterium]